VGPHRQRALSPPQDPGDLVVGLVLEVAQHDEGLIVRFQALQGPVQVGVESVGPEAVFGVDGRFDGHVPWSSLCQASSPIVGVHLVRRDPVEPGRCVGPGPGESPERPKGLVERLRGQILGLGHVGDPPNHVAENRLEVPVVDLFECLAPAHTLYNA